MIFASWKQFCLLSGQVAPSWEWLNSSVQFSTLQPCQFRLLTKPKSGDKNGADRALAPMQNQWVDDLWMSWRDCKGTTTVSVSDRNPWNKCHIPMAQSISLKQICSSALFLRDEFSLKKFRRFALANLSQPAFLPKLIFAGKKKCFANSNKNNANFHLIMSKVPPQHSLQGPFHRFFALLCCPSAPAAKRSRRILASPSSAAAWMG